MKTVDIERLTKTYMMGEVEVNALSSVSFAIQKGEYVAITGPSGSGKSTLLNLLGCLDTPTDGHYRLSGNDVSRMSDDELSDMRRDHLGFIFQSFNLIPRLTVLENIELPLFYVGLSGHECRQRAQELAERVGLARRMRHKPVELSGGERQRVAIARALVNKPDMLLADEPTGNLDTRTGRDIMALLDEVWDQGATLVVVTHDLNIAERAPRMIKLTDGQVLEDVLRESAV